VLGCVLIGLSAPLISGENYRNGEALAGGMVRVHLTYVALSLVSAVLGFRALRLR
jgi:hypothetical protein